MKILIGADLVPTESNRELFVKGDLNTLLGTKLQKMLKDADYRIFNLEVPLTDIESPIKKCGPNLIAPTDTVAGLKMIKSNFLTLANNHILDQGEQGLYSTMKLLDGVGISYAGAGNNLEDASKPFVVKINEVKLGIYCCAEHEFSIATEVTAGANPYDPLESFEHVADLKRNCDLVIVLYHGGKEHYRYPSPMLQKVFHKFAEKGADYVIAQHTHCIGCMEEYRGSTLIYGQGNFLFDHSVSEFWKTSLLIEIDVDMPDIIHHCSYIPLCKNENTVRLADDENAAKILDAFYERSRQIQQDGFINTEYEKFAQTSIQSYLKALNGNEGLVFRAVNKLLSNRLRTIKLNHCYSNRQSIRVRNYIECEAHRELLLKGLRTYE